MRVGFVAEQLRASRSKLQYFSDDLVGLFQKARLIDEDHNQIEMFFTGADGNEMKAMEINYERV